MSRAYLICGSVSHRKSLTQILLKAVGRIDGNAFRQVKLGETSAVSPGSDGAEAGLIRSPINSELSGIFFPLFPQKTEGKDPKIFVFFMFKTRLLSNWML